MGKWIKAVKNYKYDWSQTAWSLYDPFQNYNVVCQLEIQDDPHCRIKWKNLVEMFLGCCSTKCEFVYQFETTIASITWQSCRIGSNGKTNEYFLSQSNIQDGLHLATYLT
jgi:hypothetical protein